MNLADIRKKAKESRISQSSVAAVPAIEPAECNDIELMDYYISEEYDSSANNLVEEIPADDTFLDEPECSLETCSALSETQQDDFSAVKNIKEAPAQAEDFLCKPDTADVLAKAFYNPLETILAGREAASEADESSLAQTNLYGFDDVEEHLCFRIASEEYAISIMAIKEIIKPRDVTEVPRMPLFISGVISLRGVVIPVMDMRLRLSMPVSAPTGRERIVVLKQDSGFCGVLVDEVIQVARVKKSDIEAPPAVLDGIDRDFVAGLGRFDNRMLILLNLDTVLNIGVH
ncbi:MAG: chemotaxis protein CheW [Geobacteraceae bacterium]|nr:chemotaxis protein CheW [Geobacteraceae bacterium]